MPKIPNKLSAWAKFKLRWAEGCGHEMCDRASHVCLARGKIPADVVFVGEAPGTSEDVLGSPFVGQAGKLLDHITAQVIPEDVRAAYTNLVGCIPREDSAKKYGEPSKAQIVQCRTRLVEFLEMCRPKIVICVGGLAKKHVSMIQHRDYRTAEIIHPAAILRMNVAARPLEIKRAAVTIADALSVAGLA